MTVFVDANRAVRVTIRPWEDGSGYGPDWSDDFYEPSDSVYNLLVQCGCLSDTDGIDDLDDLDLPSWVDERGVVVKDVQYCIDYANDLVNGTGDFAEYGPQPDQVVDVDELDVSALPALPPVDTLASRL